MPDGVIVWGGGRWAINYLIALDNIDKYSGEIHIITSNHNITDLLKNKVTVHHDESSLPVNGAFSSIVVNKNLSHERAVAFALKNNHHILCEKPMMLSPDTIFAAFQRNINDNQLFWESMLPCYCDYFNYIRLLSQKCNNFILRWEDPFQDIPNKAHDLDITYNQDIIPHALSIASVLTSLNKNRNSWHISELSSFSDYGSFLITDHNYRFECNCSRIAEKRVRTITGYYNKELLYSYDFKNEPGHFTEFNQILKEYLDESVLLCLQENIQIQKIRPIERQLYDFIFFNAKKYWIDRPKLSIHQDIFVSRKKFK